MWWRTVEARNAVGRASPVIVSENVMGLLAKNNGEDIAAVRAAYEREGYFELRAALSLAKLYQSGRRALHPPIALLTTAVFTAAFEPAKRQIEAVQKTTQT
jgi:hypothetical protein